MLLTRTAGRVHACNLLYACAYLLRSTAACIELVSLKGNPTASNPKFPGTASNGSSHTTQEMAQAIALACRVGNSIAHACTCRCSIILPALTKHSSTHRVPAQVSNIGTLLLYEQCSVHTGTLPLRARGLCHVPEPSTCLPKWSGVVA